MFLKDGVQIDELFGQLIKSGSAVTKTVSIRCLDGYELSCDSVANLTVEAKHTADGAFTNIETTPLSTDAFAGTDADYVLRFTPTATTGVFSFRFTYQPA